MDSSTGSGCGHSPRDTCRDWHWNPGILGLTNWSFYEILFAGSGVLRFAAVVLFLPRIHEHGCGSTAETLRFMTANIYNNLFNAMLTPLRLISNATAPEPPQTRDDEPLPLRRAA